MFPFSTWQWKKFCIFGCCSGRKPKTYDESSTQSSAKQFIFATHFFQISTTSKQSSHHSYILTLPLLVSRICLAEHKQMPPPSNNKTVFAAPPQGRLGFHPCTGLDAGKMLTLSHQRWSTLSRGVSGGGLDGADSRWWQEQCAWSCGEGAETSVSTCCWWGEVQI